MFNFCSCTVQTLQRLHHPLNIQLLLHSCLHASFICTANRALNRIYNTAVIWFCCVILYAQCSTVSSALIYTTHRAHSNHGTHAQHSTTAFASTHTAQRTATMVTMAKLLMRERRKKEINPPTNWQTNQTHLYTQTIKKKVTLSYVESTTIFFTMPKKCSIISFTVFQLTL